MFSARTFKAVRTSGAISSPGRATQEAKGPHTARCGLYSDDPQLSSCEDQVALVSTDSGSLDLPLKHVRFSSMPPNRPPP